ncbi:hypothetical protein [Hymenobacter sp. YC55]|uniref:hypothetical protein n=1 Tax=Hymenobacter sp. YC55 TaxID=3034019 RepID=UPI0023F64647|nr:hypothetical protein [Hymenobacter sp. YC55]MDF7815317.1 hypothetical protein [Hymenobacter sp. YC55]
MAWHSISVDELQSYFHRLANDEKLSFEEESDFCTFLMGAESDSTDSFKRYEEICSDHVFITGLHLLSGPNAAVEEIAHRNYSPYQELRKRVDAFESKYDSNATDLFFRQVRKEFNIEHKELRKKDTGDELAEKTAVLKAKLEFLRIRSERLYDDYLAKHDLTSLDLPYGNVVIRFDKVSIMHILNRHVIRNGALDLDRITGKSLLSLSSLEDIIDRIKYLFSVLPKPTTLSGEEEVNIYFKKDLGGEIYAVHVKPIPESTKAGAKKVQRLETFYPIQEAAKLAEFAGRSFKRIRTDLYLLADKT